MRATHKHPLVSVVVPTLNEEQYLPHLLESLVGIENMDITVVDGNSTDQTTAVVSRYFDRFSGTSSLRLIQTNDRSIAKQRNLGARASNHAILLFLDADVVIPSHSTYHDLLDLFLAREWSAMNPKYTSHPLDNHRFGFWGFEIIYLLQKVSIAIGKPFFTGACIFTHRDIFERIGGFDETLLLSEDMDFARRITPHRPCGVVPIKVATSTRRLKKITFRGSLSIAKALPGLVVHGRVSNNLVTHYGFGDHR